MDVATQTDAKPTGLRALGLSITAVLMTGVVLILGAGRADAAVETKPLVVALCHGSNQSWPENFPISYYERMFTETAGSETVADFWRDISHGDFSIAGTLVLDVQLSIPRDDIGDRDQDDFGKCRDGVDAQYSVDWSTYAGPVVFKPQTIGETTIAIDDNDTQLKIRSTGHNTIDDWPSAPFTLVLTKNGSLWRNPDTDIENVLVTAVSKDYAADELTLTITREQVGYRGVNGRAKSWAAGSQVRDISDVYGSQNRTAVVSAHTGPSVINQELGHFFGFAHSRKLSTAESQYGDCFDVMSTISCVDHYFDVPYDYGSGSIDLLNGPGMVSPFLDLKGWIDPADRAVFDPPSCTQQTYAMRALGLSGSGLHQVRVPMSVDIRSGVVSDYLTIELRSQQFWWDQGIPQDAFVLHLKGDDDLSYWVDSAGGGNALGAGDWFVYDAGTAATTDDRWFFANAIDPTTGTGQITVANCPFTTTMTYGGPTTLTYHTSPEVRATFAFDSGAAAPGGTVEFTLGSTRCSDSIPGSAQRDGTGAAVCDLDVRQSPGSETLTARWAGIPGVFEPAQRDVAVTVLARDTELEVRPVGQATYLDPTTLQAILREAHHDDDGPAGSHPVQGRTVELTLGDGPSAQSCTATTDGNGSARCEIASVEQTPGPAVPVRATFSGDAEHNSSSGLGSIIVERRPTVLTLDTPSATTFGDPLTLRATLQHFRAWTPGSELPLAGRSVDLSIGSGADAQSCSAATDAAGLAECTLTVAQLPAVGVPVTASFAGGTFFRPSDQAGAILVHRRGTTVDLAPVAETIYHDPVTLAATLRDFADSGPADPAPLAGLPLTFTIGTGPQAQTCTAATDAAGRAQCTIASVEQRPDAAVAVSAAFAGDPWYRPSDDPTTFVLVKRATVLSVHGPGFAALGGALELAATLVEAATAQTPGGAVGGRVVTLQLGQGPGAQTCNAPTDSSGSARCTIADVDQALGPQAFSGTFAGDDHYLPSGASGELIVFAWTDGGHFAVGDGSAAEGAAVSFWSSQWNRENAVRAGRAPSAFKGFVSSPAGPVDCATARSWTSSGGDSAGAPAMVPEYTAVLVTDRVDKSDELISGSATRIAIVRVDPGYGPDPGLGGTAGVVGYLC